MECWFAISVSHLGCTVYSSTYMECWFAISVSHLSCLYIYIHVVWISYLCISLGLSLQFYIHGVLICYLCISLGLSLHLHTCSVDLLSLYLTWAVSTVLHTWSVDLLSLYLTWAVLSTVLHTWSVDLLSLYLTWAVSTSTYMECGFAISVSHLGCTVYSSTQCWLIHYITCLYVWLTWTVFIIVLFCDISEITFKFYNGIENIEY